MLNKIISVIIETLFPKSHLQKYLEICSQIEFEFKLTPRPQNHIRMFYPFYYKDLFVKDCIFELKERNSPDVARLFGKILAGWVIKEISQIQAFYSQNTHNTPQRTIKNIEYYLVPVPQHTTKTKEKGFCHTTTLAKSIHSKIKKSSTVHGNISLKSCIIKKNYARKLHSLKEKKERFSIIKNSMEAFITKHDAHTAYFFIIDDVFTTGATFKEVRRSLLDCGVLLEHIFFISIAH